MYRQTFFSILFLFLAHTCAAITEQPSNSELIAAFSAVFTTTDGSLIDPHNSDAALRALQQFEMVTGTNDLNQVRNMSAKELCTIVMYAAMGHYVVEPDADSIATIKIDPVTWSPKRVDSRSTNRIVTFQVLVVASFVALARMFIIINNLNLELHKSKR